MRQKELLTSDLIIILSIAYIASSAAPALYLPPVVLGFIITAYLIFAFSNAHLLAIDRAIKYPPYSRSLILLLIYLIANAGFSGLGLTEIFSYDAIRYDANIFYSIAPLLLVFHGETRIEKIDLAMNAISIVSAILYILSEHLGFVIFESHNAAGGYFMIQLAYHVGRIRKFELNIRLLSIPLLLAALIISDSRGSILAITAALIGFKIYKKNINLFKIGFTFGIVSIATGLTLSYFTWKEMGEIYLYDYSDFGATTEEIQLDTTGFGERPGTFIHRILFLYPMAIDMFLKSPIFGVGFTRFDDYPTNIGTGLFFNFNNTEHIRHSNFHAHNSYLHFLAETGIIGFALLLKFVISIFKSFKGQDETDAPAILIMGTLLFASLSEHRLTTPSQAAPAFILIALLWICKSNTHITETQPDTQPKATQNQQNHLHGINQAPTH